MPKKAKSTPPPSAANEKTPALHKAAADGNRAKVKRLLAKSKNASKDANTPTADGRTPLFYAVEGGNEGVITDLLSAKANVHATAEIEISSGDNLSSATLLHSSVLFDHLAAIDIFSRKGTKVNQRSDEGLTPLHLATCLDRPAAVRALIKNGAKVKLGSKDKVTPLHLAARFNRSIVAGILIANGAKLDAADANKDTPMHDAARKGSFDVAKRLIGAGAKINEKNEGKRTPLYIAQDEGHNEVADVLIDASKFRNVSVALPPKRKGIAEQVYAGVWMSIVAIYDGDKFLGSGVIVKDGIVVTNHHVVKRDGDFLVKKAKNRRIDAEDENVAEPIEDNEMQDLSLLKVKGLKRPGNPMQIRTYNSLRVGEDIYAVGNPAAMDANGNAVPLDLSLSAGVISQLREEGHREIQMDAAISGGSSGGGLFDRRGNLVGITTSSVVEGNDPQNLNFAIPADWLLGYFAK